MCLFAQQRPRHKLSSIMLCHIPFHSVLWKHFVCNVSYSIYLSVIPSEGCQHDRLCYIYRKLVPLLCLRFLMILN